MAGMDMIHRPKSMASKAVLAIVAAMHQVAINRNLH